MEQVRNIDINVLQALKNVRTENLADFFYLLTQLGDSIFIVITAIVIAGFFYYFGSRRYASVILGVVVGTYITVYWLKSFFDRERPLSELSYYLEDSLSFPSGHAAIAIAFYGLIIYFIHKAKLSSKKKSMASIALILLMFLISFSRLFLGVHYLSDVVGGLFVGFIWLYAGITYLRKYN